MEKTLTGKTALVCGGSGGLGYGAASEMARLGAKIILVARNESKLQEKLATLKEINDIDHHYVVCDFNDMNLVHSTFKDLASNQAIHILINNCGGPAPGPLLKAKSEDLLKAFQLHIIVSHEITKYVVPVMQSEGYGRIINIVSTSVRQPIMGLGVSNTIRGATASWSKTMSLELAASGVTVNNILPGATKTPQLTNILKSKQEKFNISKEEAENNYLSQIPMGRFAEVEEVSKTIAFLASPGAAYITGVSLQVDGGRIKSI